MLGDPFGTHRVLEPKGALPQPAWRLDNDPSLRYETEIHVDVETLNIDAASFRQMESASGGRDEDIARQVRETVDERGKQHNPVTGSGGMLLGRVSWVGPRAAERGFAVGDRVATLASLSLTPLSLAEVRAVRRESAQLDVTGTAVIFSSAPLVRLPTDLGERLALAVCDVAGAAPQVARHTAPGNRVVVLGAGGKSGLLSCAAARSRVASDHVTQRGLRPASGCVIGVEADERYAAELESLELCDRVIRADAREPLAVRDAVLGAMSGTEADVVISCVNVPGVEPTAIFLTRPRGKIYFFAMSTSFTAAALGAEGISKDIDMYIGNGYAEGHAEQTLELVRSSPRLRAVLERRYG
jgi:L-erythro-3,5-diaminohexanoate dehydrogenase